MATLYNKDLIAERDHKSKITHSIIKCWQVNYLDRETILRLEEEKQKAKEDDEALKLAAEINERLAREAAIDEAIKQAEIQAAFAEADFNSTTGSYSGAYGKNISLDDDKRNQVDNILNEKDNYIKNLFENAN